MILIQRVSDRVLFIGYGQKIIGATIPQDGAALWDNETWDNFNWG